MTIEWVDEVKELKEAIEAAKASGDIEKLQQHSEKGVEFTKALLNRVFSSLNSLKSSPIDSLQFTTAGLDFESAHTLADQFCETCCYVGFAGLSSLEFCSASECFSAAENASAEFNEMYKRVLDILEKVNGKVPEVFCDRVKQSLDKMEWNYTFSQAFYEFALAQLNKMNRSPDVAVEHFRAAQDNFDSLYKKTNESIYRFYSEYTYALGIAMGASENYWRGNLTVARSQFLQAKSGIERILEQTLPQWGRTIDEQQYQRIESAVKIDLNEVEALYYLCDAKYQFGRSSFSLAVEQYDKVCQILSETIETSAGVLTKQAQDFAKGEYHTHCGEHYLAEGELFREQEKWDEALQSYSKARKEWQKAAEYYAKSGVPQATALQENIMNLSTSLESYERQCGRERQLKSEIKELESKIKKLEGEISTLMQSVQTAIKPVGQTINNIQQLSSTFEANVQFNLTIENQVKKNIEDLVKQLQNLPIDDNTKQDIKNKANDVLNSTEHGHNFLDRVKRFTKDIAEITKNIGEAAKPILPFVGALSVFAGLPPMPIL